MKHLLVLLLLLFLMLQPIYSQQMDYNQLDKVLQIECDSATGGDGSWQILYGGRVMMLIADANNNRMRIISPIRKKQKLKSEELENLLIANFHSALDVKYALSDDILWSVFIHPLKELNDEQIKSALSQVYWAAENFGTSYQSTDMVFPKPPKKNPPADKSTKLQKL